MAPLNFPETDYFYLVPFKAGDSLLYISIVKTLMTRPFSTLNGNALNSTTSSFVLINGINSPKEAINWFTGINCSNIGSRIK